MKGTIWPRPFEKDPTIGVRKPVKGSTWTYQFAVQRAGKRQQISKGGFRTKRECEQALAEAIASVEDTVHVAPSKLTLVAYLRDEWLPSLHSQDLKPSSIESYRSLVVSYVIPHLGDVRLIDITAGDLDRLYTLLRREGRTSRKGGLSASSVHHVHVALSKAFGDAVEAGRIGRSPLDRLGKSRRPKSSKGAAPEMRTWTGLELRAFLAGAESDRLVGLFDLAAATGMRRGELVGLRWNDVDLDAGQVAVRRARTAVNYTAVEGTPKSKRARTVAIDPGAVAALRTHRRRQLEEKMAWGPRWTDTGYVFTREDGTPLHPQTATWHFTKLTKAAGLPVIRFHDLRHTHATLGLAAGVPPKVMQERLGHSSVQITLDLYSQVVPGMQEDAAARIAAAYR